MLLSSCGAGASLVAEHGLQVCGLQQLQLSGSGVAVPGLSGSAACGVLVTQPGIGLRPLHWQEILTPWTIREVPTVYSQ